MKFKFIRAGQFLLLIAVFSLAGCSSATPLPTIPTQDATLLIKSAIQTVEAHITETALSQPTSTVTSTATTTPLPTDTLAPTASPLPTDTFTPTATNTPAVTNTPTPFPLSAKALYTTSYPGNKREYTPNEKFGLAIGFLNTGIIPWSNDYEIRIVGFKGEVTVQQEARLGKGVKPGEKGEFNLWAFGSETLGQHVWYFQLFTDSGSAVPGGYASFTYTSK